MAKTFNELRIYRVAIEIDGLVWPLRKQIQAVSPGLWDQLDRSVGSVADNIAEGFGRETRADFRNFLRYSRGSAHEVDSQVDRAKRRALVAEATATQIVALCKDVSYRIKNFQKRLAKAPKSSNSYEVREPTAAYLSTWEQELEAQVPDWWARTEESDYPDEHFDQRL